MVEVTATVVSDSVAAVVSGGIVVVAVAVRTVTAVATAAVVCVCGDCVSVGGMDIAGAVSAGVGRGSSGITSTGRSFWDGVGLGQQNIAQGRDLVNGQRTETPGTKRCQNFRKLQHGSYLLFGETALRIVQAYAAVWKRYAV